jgi:hypothetical protein
MSDVRLIGLQMLAAELKSDQRPDASGRESIRS